jgi:hypothetical protein
MENECTYVNSRGILKACTLFQKPIQSSNPTLNTKFLDNVKEGDRVYICTTAIPKFANDVLAKLTVPIVLVTGDADESIPTVDPKGCAKILDSPFIVKWFAQNCLCSHPKLVKIPIGMDFHTLNDRPSFWGPKEIPGKQENDIQAIAAKAKPFWERIPTCYTTFNIEINRGDRLDAYLTLPLELVYYEATPVPRLESHKRQSTYAFVVSPHGYGFDCHRTWEALVLGCIPIIKSNAMDSLFDGLPVLIVKKWDDVTQELLDSTLKSFKGRTFAYEKLRIKYWIDLIYAR